MALKKVERIILLVLFIGLMTLFAFSDLPIMQTLFDWNNVYGRLGENLGEVPFQLLGATAMLWLFRFRDKSTRFKNWFFGILYLLFALIFIVYGGGMVWSYLGADYYGFGGKHIWILVGVAALYAIIASLLAFLPHFEDPKEVVAFALFFGIFYLGTLLFMNLFKLIWYRPRWRYLFTTYGDQAANYFQPWFVIPGVSRKIGDNNFASFPSGHTMNALGIISLSLAPNFIKKWQGKELVFRLAAYLWAALVALSRIIMGAHFASDVTAGFFLEVLLFDLLAMFVYPKLRDAVHKEVPAAVQEA